MNDNLASWIFTSTTFYFIKTIFMHCGEIFKILRKWKKISQQQLAKKLNTSQQYISVLEKQEHLSGEKLTMLLKGINSTREEWERFKKLTPPH
jgi:transcriptional regulator with XRE-family HTH domain